MAKASYTFQQISVAGAAGDTVASGINDAGTIAGWSVPGGYDIYPTSFIDSGGTITQLTGFAGAPDAAAAGINAAGQVSGTIGNAVIGIRAFLWDPSGSLQLIGSNTTGASGSFAHGGGVNDHGQVVGSNYAGDAIHSYNSFVWQAGHMTFIAAPGAVQTDARGIANDGTVVGFYDAGRLPDGSMTPEHAFIDRNGHFSEIKVAGAKSAEADGISANGKIIVGTFEDALGHSHGWLQENGHIKKIDMPGAVGTSILGVNDQGAIVGSYLVAGDPVKHAFVANPH